MGLSSHQSARMKNDEWLTPPEILRALGPFDLDPCAPVIRPWETAATHYTVEDDGLSKPWVGRALLTISDDDTITPCPQNCRHQHTRNARDAERLSLSPWSISVPVPADHSAFFHVAGSVWHRSTQNESGNSASSAQVNAVNTSRQESSDARNVIASSPQRSNFLAQTQDAATDLLRGAENAQGNWQGTIEQSYEHLPQGNRRSGKSGSDTLNPISERKQSNPAQESITQSADREELTYRLSGSIPTGWTVSLHSETPAHTAVQQEACTKTISSHYPTLNAPELLSATWCLPAHHATYQKGPSIRVHGLKAKLLSLGLLTPCGCFVGTYKPRVWLNPPFGREAVKWLRKMRDHGNGIALVPARTETAMFYETVWGCADSVLFIKGRPHFYTVEGTRAPFNSGAPIVLIAYGKHNTETLLDSKLGTVMQQILRKD